MDVVENGCMVLHLSAIGEERVMRLMVTGIEIKLLHLSQLLESTTLAGQDHPPSYQ